MSERMFTVIVPRSGSAGLSYPPQTGIKVLANMATLSRKGHAPVALTSANGIDEALTFAELKTIYGE